MTQPIVELVKVKRVSDADGCYCLQCQCVIADYLDSYWHWRKSQKLHERGTGHTVIMIKLEVKQ